MRKQTQQNQETLKHLLWNCLHRPHILKKHLSPAHALSDGIFHCSTEIRARMFDADKPAESIIFTLAATTMTGWENPAPAYACKGFFKIISVKPFVQSFPAFKSNKKVWSFLNNQAKLTPCFSNCFQGVRVFAFYSYSCDSLTTHDKLASTMSNL